MSTTLQEPQPLTGAGWVAKRLGETTHRVYDLARRGIIPSVRIGRAVKFDPQRIEDFIAAGGQALPGGWKREAD